MTTSKLADRFEPVDYQTWRAKVEKDLKGVPFERLSSRTHEGFELEPLYHRETKGEPLARVPRLAAGSWIACQAHGDPDLDRASAAIAEDVAAGAEAIWLDAALVEANADLTRLLGGVDLAKLTIYLEAGAAPKKALESLLALGEPASLRGAVGGDPLGALARQGALPRSTAKALDELAAVAKRAASDAPGLRACVISTRPYHDAGASASHELAFALATGVAYLRRLTSGEHALSLEQALGQLVFSFSVGRDLFLELAKLRAARALWARVVEACGADPDAHPMLLHARTAWRNKTACDPWVNMLRTTVESFVAAVGGADLVTTAGFDEVAGASDGFARRIARNAQTILDEEAGLGRVVDPAAGSWYVESLTRELGEHAWRALGELDAAGGMAQCLERGLVASWIEVTRKAREAAAGTRREPITGVSEFANLAEEPVTRPVLPAQAPAAGPAALPSWRASRPYELLRRNAEGAGRRLVLLQLGEPRDFRARADFARSLIEAGGIATSPSPPVTTVAEALTAATADEDADGVVLCSSDARYAEVLPELVPKLREASASVVLLAGKGGAHEKAFREAGVHGFLYAGCNALVTLTALHQQLGLGAVAQGDLR